MEVNERKLFNIVGGTVSPHFDKIFPKGTERLADCISVIRLTKDRFFGSKKGELWVYVDTKKCPEECFLDFTEPFKRYDLTEELYNALNLCFNPLNIGENYERRRVKVAAFLLEWSKKNED